MTETIIDKSTFVVSYLDDDKTVPADYLIKWSNGYEAFVANMDDSDFYSVSIGRYSTWQGALRAIWAWNEIDEKKAN
jgi:hypothetical protein